MNFFPCYFVLLKLIILPVLAPIGQEQDNFFTDIVPDLVVDIGKELDRLFSFVTPDAFAHFGNNLPNDVLGEYVPHY